MNGADLQKTDGKLSQSRWLRRGLLMLLAVLAAPLLMHAFLGTFSRPLADDFCTWGWLNEAGFWGSQAYWYLQWSGRFAFTALMTLSHYLGPGLTPLLPSLWLALWGAAAFWTAKPLLGSEWGDQAIPAAALMAGVLLVGVFNAAPNLYQTLYWHTGSMTYLAPLILFTLYLGWMLRQRRSTKHAGAGWSAPLIAAAFPFVAGGFNETFAALQLSALTLVAVAAWVFGRRRLGLLSVFGLLGALLSLAVVAAAPGNAARAGLLGGASPLPQVLQRSSWNAYVFGWRLVRYQAPLLALLVLTPLAVSVWRGRPRAANLKRAALATLAAPALAYVGVLVVMAPSEYALASYPDGRILVNAAYVVVIALLCWGWLLGRWLAPALLPRFLSRRTATALLLGAALAAGGWQAWQSVENDLELLPDARQFASAWDQRHRAVLEERSQGELELEVASLSHMGGLAEIDRDPDTWINRCFADAYGVHSVVAK